MLFVWQSLWKRSKRAQYKMLDVLRVARRRYESDQGMMSHVQQNKEIARKSKTQTVGQVRLPHVL